MLEVAKNQCGIVSRRQALAAGLSPAAILARTKSRRWQTVHRATYATFTGDLSRDAAIWAAILAAGPGATASHHTAAELAGLIDQRRPEIHLIVPSTRRIVRPQGTIVHLSNRVDDARHPVRLPPQTRIEETVLDLVDVSRSIDDAVAWLAAACGRRLTTASRLRDAAALRPKLRWRRECDVALGEVEGGCQSVLELRYLHDVERAHGLPPGTRQAPAERMGGRIFQDVRYPDYGTVVELDGVVAHQSEALFRDLTRDNVAGLRGDSVLHYGWTDITTRSCEVASQVAARLRLSGWRQAPHRCHQGTCVITKV